MTYLDEARRTLP